MSVHSNLPAICKLGECGVVPPFLWYRLTWKLLKNLLEEWHICRCLRGAEVIEIRDAQGNLFNDFRGRVRPEDAARGRSGSRRTILLALDAAQYQLDVDTLEPEGAAGGKMGGAAELYASFNVVQRRKAKENNFKAVLESIRDLMTESTTIPEWMHDLFLGYGAPEDTQFAVCTPSLP